MTKPLTDTVFDWSYSPREYLALGLLRLNAALIGYWVTKGSRVSRHRRQPPQPLESWEPWEAACFRFCLFSRSNLTSPRFYRSTFLPFPHLSSSIFTTAFPSSTTQLL